MEVACYLPQLEAMHGGQRQNNSVFGRSGLQLEVEGPAEALTQRQTPGAVDPTAKRGVDDELHAAGFIEEALEDDGVTGWQRAERRAPGREITHELHRRRRLDADFVDEPAERWFEGGGHGGGEEL